MSISPSLPPFLTARPSSPVSKPAFLQIFLSHPRQAEFLNALSQAIAPPLFDNSASQNLFQTAFQYAKQQQGVCIAARSLQGEGVYPFLELQKSLQLPIASTSSIPFHLSECALEYLGFKHHPNQSQPQAIQTTLLNKIPPVELTQAHIRLFDFFKNQPGFLVTQRLPSEQVMIYQPHEKIYPQRINQYPGLYSQPGYPTRELKN